MTRKKLEAVYWLKKELIHWQTRKAEIEADIALSPKVLDGMPFTHTNGISNPTEAKAIKLEEATREITKRMVAITKALNDIDKYLAELSAKDDGETSKLSYILWCRCENNMKWHDIAKACGMTDDAVKKTYYRFMDTLPEE